MTTSGLVLTLSPDPELAGDAVTTMLLSGPFVLGDMVGRRLAVALEADHPSDAHDWHDWLLTLPGVEKVDVAFVHVGEEAAHVR
jgi:hypothetical protein